MIKTFPPNAKHDAVLGTTFPPNAQHDAVLGTTFPLKAHTTPFWGPSFPPNFPRWTGPFFLSFLVSFLFWFALSGLMGLGFFSTSYINVCIMGYYMTMNLGFFFPISDINVCIMDYYMTMGLGFFCKLIY
jgi:hypothetical protein